MKLITIRTPKGQGRAVAALAFEKDIKEVAISSAEVMRSNELSEVQDVVEIETATPNAKRFIEALMETPFYEPGTYSFTIRHPEALFGAKPPKEELHPVVRPTTNVYEELYQFTKITASLVARVFLSAILLSYGMVEDFLPLVIAGLLFLPFHHHMIGIALGSMIKEWQFLRQAALALVVSTILIFLAGVLVAMFTKPPVLFEIKDSLLSGALLAAVIGIAAAFASVDDAGRRELIGLAASAHISIYPAWFGLQLVFSETEKYKVTEYLFAFFINVTVLILASLITYAVVGMRGEGIRKFIRAFIRDKSETG